MVPEVQPRPVITREDDQRIVRHTVSIECLENLPGRPVHLLHDVAVQALVARAPESLGHAQRDMGHRVGEVEKEGAVTVTIDEVDGAFRIADRESVLVRQLVDRLDRIISFDER